MNKIKRFWTLMSTLLLMITFLNACLNKQNIYTTKKATIKKLHS